MPEIPSMSGSNSSRHYQSVNVSNVKPSLNNNLIPKSLFLTMLTANKMR
jgi:hypothetical protein